MREFFLYIRNHILIALPALVLIFASIKVNLKKKNRNRQLLMPILALVYALVTSILPVVIYNKIADFQASEWINAVERWFEEKISGTASGIVAAILGAVGKVMSWIADAVNLSSFTVIFMLLLNSLIVLGYIILKSVLLEPVKGICNPKYGWYEKISGLFYEKDAEDEKQYWLREDKRHLRLFLKVLFFVTTFVLFLAMLVSCWLYSKDLIALPLLGAPAAILAGECWFALNGLFAKKEEESEVSGEEEETNKKVNYSIIRDALKKLFGDKLSSDEVSVSGSLQEDSGVNAYLDSLIDGGVPMLETYGRFMQYKQAEGIELDVSYLRAGQDLLQGKNVLFHNPFYSDLKPYVFYPMNRILMDHKTVLLVMGRHGEEEAAAEWCREGLSSVVHTDALWKINVLGKDSQETDIGIITRSSVHDMAVHDANHEFLKNCAMVVLFEPSKLITTAQIGLNSLIRNMKNEEVDSPVYVAMDKNCDGLVDALSHILLTPFEEVSATTHHTGRLTYMGWDGDSEHLQHRLLPNLSRYLGMGTELSTVGLKHQVDKVFWYGGEAFPVRDIRWITEQYYYDLMQYAELPPTQEELNERMIFRTDMWSSEKSDYRYMTVEDEAFNLFEARRQFATRAKQEGFINVITSDYLLKDYMTENDGVFRSDAKAIPYIAADYAHTNRNIVLRLCLRMSSGSIWEEELVRELLLLDSDIKDPLTSFFTELAACYKPVGAEDKGKEIQIIENGKTYTYDQTVIRKKRKFRSEKNQMENSYFIDDDRFLNYVIGELRNLEYIAEDERENEQYVASEIRGQIFQKYLPGEFFVLDGRQYEMLRVTGDGRLLMRRAADHITGRKTYRQKRAYTLNGYETSTRMGETKVIDGLEVSLLKADFSVSTSGYYEMDRYYDFETARFIEVSGIPERSYYGKRMLKLSFSDQEESVSPDVIRTLTDLLNELFRTVYAENQPYIVAVTPGEANIPLTYSLGGESAEKNSQSIFIIEDSQLDLGLLESVNRNLDRFLGIICEYLDWHLETLKKSLNPETGPGLILVEIPEKEGEGSEEGSEKDKKKKKGILGFFQRLIEKIKEFFRKLFRKKKKPEAIPEGEEPEEELAGGDPEEELEGEEPKEELEGEEPEEKLEGEEPEEQPVDGIEEEQEAETEETGDAAETEGEGGMDEKPEAEGSSEDEADDEADDGYEDDPLSDLPSTLGSRKVFIELAEDVKDDPHSEPQDGFQTDPQDVPQPEGTTVSGEADGAVKAGTAPEFKRKEYHLRHYLLYGGTEMPSGIAPEETLEFLKKHGYGRNGLTQARKGQHLAEQIEQGISGDGKGHRCDFCGRSLTGVEFEVLKDGRERCSNCSRTAIRNEKEFVKLYNDVISQMKLFFNVQIKVPVTVKMVNAKTLQKAWGKGKPFIPTAGFTPRTLGFARRKGNKFEIMVENGSPKIQGAMTLAHELTHIWQYTNWNMENISKTYGSIELEVYEGMARWVEIQYAFFIHEAAEARREQYGTMLQDDEYGRGFIKYLGQYPLSEDGSNVKDSPFEHPDLPLKIK